MKLNPFPFIRAVQAEGRKVVWPKMRETRTMTLMVFVLVVLVALYLLAIDAIISSIIQWLLGA